MNTSILFLLLVTLVYSLGPDTGAGAGTVPGGAATDGTYLYVGTDGNPSSFKVYRNADLSCVYTIDTTAIITNIDTVLLDASRTAVLVGSGAVASIDLATRTIKNTVQIARSNAQLAFNDENNVYIINDDNMLEKRSFSDLSLASTLQLQSAMNFIGITPSNVALVQGIGFIERIDLTTFTLLSRFEYDANNNHQNAKLLGSTMFDFKVTNFPKTTCSGFAVSINRYDVSNGFELSGSSVNITTGDYQCGGGIVSPIVQFVIDQDSSSIFALSSTNSRSVSGMGGTVTDQTVFVLNSGTMQVTGGTFELANSGTFFSPTTWKVAPSFYLSVNGALLYSSAFLKSTEYNPDTEEYYYSLREKGEINRVVNQVLTNSVTIDSANCAVVTTVAPTIATTVAPTTSTSTPTSTMISTTTTTTQAPTTTTTETQTVPPTIPTTTTEAATATTTQAPTATTTETQTVPPTIPTTTIVSTTTTAPITPTTTVSTSTTSTAQTSTTSTTAVTTTSTSAPVVTTTSTVAPTSPGSSSTASTTTSVSPSSTTSTSSPSTSSTSASTTTTTSSPTQSSTNSPLNDRDATSSATKALVSSALLVAILFL